MRPDFKYKIRFNGKLTNKVILPGEDLDQELLWWEQTHPNDVVEIVRINPSEQKSAASNW